MGRKAGDAIVYAHIWPEAMVIKIGLTSHRRWLSFRGGRLAAYYVADTVHDACIREEEWLGITRPLGAPAFADRSEAVPYLGGNGGGWKECTRLPGDLDAHALSMPGAIPGAMHGRNGRTDGAETPQDRGDIQDYQDAREPLPVDPVDGSQSTAAVTQPDIYDLLAETETEQPVQPQRTSSTLPIGEYRQQPLTCTDDQHLPRCWNPNAGVTACICGTAWWVGEVGTWHSTPRRAPEPAMPLLGIGNGAVGHRGVETEFYGWDTYFLHASECPLPHAERDPLKACPGGTCGGTEPMTYAAAAQAVATETALRSAGVCPRCDHRHATQDATVSGSRFALGALPYAYRALYPDAPARTTREQAIQDMCDHRAAQHAARNDTKEQDQ